MTNTEAYAPSEELRTALRRWKTLVSAEQDARRELRTAVAEEMTTTGVSNSELADHLPFTQEWVRGVAVERGVPGGRRRALRGIKQKLETNA